jgi:hypothetical protein
MLDEFLVGQNLFCVFSQIDLPFFGLTALDNAPFFVIPHMKK